MNALMMQKKKGKKGLVALGSEKKIHFLTDPNFLKYKGFEVCDTAKPSFELLFLPFDNDCHKPSFKDCVTGEIESEDVVFITLVAVHTLINTYLSLENIWRISMFLIR